MASPGRASTQPGLSLHPSDMDASLGTLLFGKRTRKPNSVLCGHSSRRRVTTDAHQRPTRRFQRFRNRLDASGRCVARAWLLARASLPIWSCSVWGLPCHSHYWLRGALLPHLFTLTGDWPFRRTPFGPACWVPRVSRIRRPGKSHPGGMFSVALAVHEPSRSRPGRYPAHCPAEFGLSSPANPCSRRDFRQRPPGPPASLQCTPKSVVPVPSPSFTNHTSVAFDIKVPHRASRTIRAQNRNPCNLSPEPSLFPHSSPPSSCLPLLLGRNNSPVPRLT